LGNQREMESVVWHFIADTLNETSPERIQEWFYSLPPSSAAQKKRWVKAISKVFNQAVRYAGDEQLEDNKSVRYRYDPD